MAFSTSVFAQKPGEGRDNPKTETTQPVSETDSPVKPVKDKPVTSDTESPVKPPVTSETDSPVKPPKDKPVTSDTESPVKPPVKPPVTSETDSPVKPPVIEETSPVKPPKDKPVKGNPEQSETVATPVKGKGPSQAVIQKAEENSNGNAFSGKGKGGDKNMMDPVKKDKKSKKMKEHKGHSKSETGGGYNPPPRPMNPNR